MQKNEAMQENKMGVMPINRLLLNMSIPMMISMIVQALYNIVDSMYVSWISESALTAVSLAFPVQSLMIAVGSGTGVGINALLSRSLGMGDAEAASRTARNGLFLALVSSIAFLIIGLTCVSPFFHSQTSDGEITSMGIGYLTICCCVSLPLFGQFTFERLLQSTGKTFYVMITQGTGAIINIALDPVLIFGWLGFPALGVNGAAIATVFGQFCAMLMAVFFCIKKNKEISLNFRGFRPDGRIIKGIYSVGAPSIIMQSIGSVMTYSLNRILITFTATATAVFGVYFKLQSFIFMPVFGLNNGVVPIIAYNYGARKRERIIGVTKLGVLYAVSIMLIGFLLFQLIPDKLLMIFNASPDMLAIGAPALRIISLSFLFAGFCIVCGSVFQAMGDGMMSLIVSVMRQLVALIPAAYLLSLTGRLELVWLSFPIAELFSLAFSALFLRKIYRTKIKPLGETPAQD